MGIKGAIKKRAKQVGRATGVTQAGQGAARRVRSGARSVSESVPGYGSYAKTMRELTRDGKKKK